MTRKEECVMSKKKGKARKSYPPEFKAEAVELAKEIGLKRASEKLGIGSPQVLGAWSRHAKKLEEDADFRNLEALRAENKWLKRELEVERKSVAILKDAAAFMDAVKKTPGNLEGLVFHSDRGIQYCSSVVRDRLKLLGVAQSMSRKGNCHDNAFAESFFHTLKNELEKGKFKDLDEARAMVSGYINWYNRERMHSSLGYSSPMDYVNRKVGNVA